MVVVVQGVVFQQCGVVVEVLVVQVFDVLVCWFDVVDVQCIYCVVMLMCVFLLILGWYDCVKIEWDVILFECVCGSDLVFLWNVCFFVEVKVFVDVVMIDLLWLLCGLILFVQVVFDMVYVFEMYQGMVYVYGVLLYVLMIDEMMLLCEVLYCCDVFVDVMLCLLGVVSWMQLLFVQVSFEYVSVFVQQLDVDLDGFGVIWYVLLILL